MTYQEAIEAMERDFLPKVMAEHGWNLSAAAGTLEIDRNTLRKRLKVHGIKAPEGFKCAAPVGPDRAPMTLFPHAKRAHDRWVMDLAGRVHG